MAWLDGLQKTGWEQAESAGVEESGKVLLGANVLNGAICCVARKTGRCVRCRVWHAHCGATGDVPGTICGGAFAFDCGLSIFAHFDVVFGMKSNAVVVLLAELVDADEGVGLEAVKNEAQQFGMVVESLLAKGTIALLFVSMLSPFATWTEGLLLVAVRLGFCVQAVAGGASVDKIAVWFACQLGGTKVGPKDEVILDVTVVPHLHNRWQRCMLPPCCMLVQVASLMCPSASVSYSVSEWMQLLWVQQQAGGERGPLPRPMLPPRPMVPHPRPLPCPPQPRLGVWLLF